MLMWSTMTDFSSMGFGGVFHLTAAEGVGNDPTFHHQSAPRARLKLACLSLLLTSFCRGASLDDHCAFSDWLKSRRVVLCNMYSLPFLAIRCCDDVHKTKFIVPSGRCTDWMSFNSITKYGSNVLSFFSFFFFGSGYVKGRNVLANHRTVASYHRESKI